MKRAFGAQEEQGDSHKEDISKAIARLYRVIVGTCCACTQIPQVGWGHLAYLPGKHLEVVDADHRILLSDLAALNKLRHYWM